MNRRLVVSAMTASAVAAPLAAIAQTPATVRRIGMLTLGAAQPRVTPDASFSPLRARGWVEGKNLLVERRDANFKIELLRSFAEELVRLRVELIGTHSTPAALAAKDATRTIPIVLWSAADPVGSGLVASLARPGGNVTGFSYASPDMDIKRVQLLRELVPGLRRVGVLETANPFYRTRRSDFEQTCRSVGVQPIFVEVATREEVVDAIIEMARRGAQALTVPEEPLFYENAGAIMAAASKFALATMATTPEFWAAGALVIFTHSSEEQDERFAWFVDKIFHGAKPADLPIQQPTRFAMSVNVKTAKTLGLTVPRSVLMRADEVRE
jgi:putative ABC transport system substrate-binding protein